MWQRVQTVWWLIAIIALLFFAVYDFTYYSVSTRPFELLQHNSLGIYSSNIGYIYHTYAVAVLVSISILLSLLSIFIYKMRPYQIRLSILNIFILLGILGVWVYSVYSFTSIHEGIKFEGISLWLSMPLVAIVAQLLATRAVVKDELLIRMSQRLR